MVNHKIIIITGTPGVWKTTVTKELAARLPAELVDVSELVKNENLVTEKDAERGTLVANILKLRAHISNILRKAKGDIIIEGHYAYDLVPKVVNPYVFVLRRDPYDLEATLKGRGYNERKVSENVAAEVLDVCLIGAIRKFGKRRLDEIDVTHRDIETVVYEILSVLKGEKAPESGKVDWLGKLEEDGRLELFLSDIVRAEGEEYGHPADDIET
jgi:adenylate kinase